MINRLLFFTTLFFLTSCATQKATLTEMADARKVMLYETTTDFINKNPKKVEARVIVRDRSKQHVSITKIFNLSTRMPIDRAWSAWAIEFDGRNYFNLGYSDDLNNWKSYAKFNIEGKICAVVIDEKSPNVLKGDGKNYGLGLTGVLTDVVMGGINKLNTKWIDKNGNKKRILFIDTRNQIPRNMARNYGCLGNYLTSKELKSLIKEHSIDVEYEKINDIPFEKVIEIINTINMQ